MTMALNIVAVIMLTVVPYIRPCSHGGFKLFCTCGMKHAAQQHATVKAPEKKGAAPSPC